jgi:hypothetical protein
VYIDFYYKWYNNENQEILLREINRQSGKPRKEGIQNGKEKH